MGWFKGWITGKPHISMGKSMVSCTSRFSLKPMTHTHIYIYVWLYMHVYSLECYADGKNVGFFVPSLSRPDCDWCTSAFPSRAGGNVAHRHFTRVSGIFPAELKGHGLGAIIAYWCSVGNGWEWGNGMIITSDYGSFPHSLLSTSKNCKGKEMLTNQ